MRILINIVPKDHLNWTSLTSLISDLKSQKFSDYAINLHLSPKQRLSQKQQVAIHEWHLSQNRQISAHADYVINLLDTDHVLPGALSQWNQIICLHPGSLISLATFDSRYSLTEQVTTYLTNHQFTNLQTTYQNLLGQPVSLTTLMGIQNYSVQYNSQAKRLLSQRLKCTGILLPMPLIDSTNSITALSQALNTLQRAPTTIRLHVPTLATQPWSRVAPLSWVNELKKLGSLTLDPSWQPIIAGFIQQQLKGVLKQVNHRTLSSKEHVKLLQHIKKLALPTRQWSRLKLLQILPINIAHLIFF